MKTLEQVRRLADVDVVDGLDRLIVKDRLVGADIVAHLVVVKERSIHLDLGHPSIVAYCEERLRCSKEVAYKRAAAVSVAEEHPAVLSWLADGTMTLSGLVALAPHRDDADLVAEARGMSKREIKELVAAAHPDPNWSRMTVASACAATASSARSSSASTVPSCPSAGSARGWW
jgi:hypothetical protein